MSLPIVYSEARAELEEIINAGARALKGPGRDLMPIKREMLVGLEPDQINLIIEACDLLFAAILNYENAQWNISHATDPISLVDARIEGGRALGVVESLFFGPTRWLFTSAMNHAPIAYYAMSEASPDLQIINRTIGKKP